MNCYVHPDKEAIGACTACHKKICKQCAVEIRGKLVCRECLNVGMVKSPETNKKDPNTAYLIELIGGFFGLLGLGYFYVGQTNEGIIRLIIWIIYNVFAYIIISVLISLVVGIACCPFQLIIQIGVPIWSATTLKNQLLGNAN